jgi:hypothetical protein
LGIPGPKRFSKVEFRVRTSRENKCCFLIFVAAAWETVNESNYYGQKSEKEALDIYPADVRIASAFGIKEVWKRFVLFIEGYLDDGTKKGIIAAWGGQSCDCEWLFRITEDSHHGVLFMRRWCPYFMDPKKVVSHYGSCKLNQKHSDVIGYGCDEMWCFVTGNESLPGAHSAIIDAKAQCTIVEDKPFFDFIDKPVAMIAMTDVWAAKRKNRDIRNAELKRKLPAGWTEGEEGSAWKLAPNKEYSFAGGGHHGPSLAAKTVCEAQSLGKLFLFFFPIQFLEIIARETNRYGNEDWVRPVARTTVDDDDDDNDSLTSVTSENGDQPESKEMLKACLQSHVDARHRFKGATKKWRNVTPGFILVFFGIICILGATKIRNVESVLLANLLLAFQRCLACNVQHHQSGGRRQGPPLA